VKQRHQAGGHEPQACECLAQLNEVAEERCIGCHESLQDGDEEAGQVATTDRGEKQPTELGGERSKQELISTGEQPLVADDELEASERNVGGSGASGPFVQWRRAQVTSALNRQCSWSFLYLRVGWSNYGCLLWEPATNLNCAVACSLSCLVLRLCRFACQEDGALCRPGMREHSSFL